MPINYRIPELGINNLPDDVLKDVGKSIAVSFRKRIREGNRTADGDSLSPNHPAWEAVKLGIKPARFNEGGGDSFYIPPSQPAISAKPLVYTGEMTDPKKAWKIEITRNRVDVRMHGIALEHAQSVIDHARRKGKNWEDAFKIGKAERVAATTVVISWLKTGKLISVERLLGGSI